VTRAAITAWRIVKAKYASSAFDGEGARRFAGRWNSRGAPMVYTAGSQALAVLELLVHLEDSDLLKHYRLIPVTFDESMVQVLDNKILPPNWKRRPTPTATRALGDAWIAADKSVVLQVPSVVVPGENNYLLNPRHPDFAKLSIGKPQPYRFDPRLR
jgi:RES domain-containing protein